MNLPDQYPLENNWDTGRASTLGRLVRLIRKELSEILRDRRTIMTLVFMPVLLYPLLSLAFQQFLLASTPPVTKINTDALRFGFRSEEEQARFEEDWKKAGQLPKKQWDKLIHPELFADIQPDLQELKAKLYNREIDLIVLLADKEQINAREVVEWEVYFLDDSQRSKKAFHQVAEWLALINTSILLSLPPDPRQPRTDPILWATGKALTAPSKPEEFPLGSLVPLILILMTITGAVYPAIDLTAGERERGTLEILVAAPVPRMGLLFAKYVTVMTVAVLTALVNLVMMTVTVSSSGMGHLLFGDTGLTLLLVLQIFGLLLLFAGFFSAVLLTITSFARSFKEAQAYLIPLMLVSLAPGLAGMIPGLKMTPLLALVPLLNIVLLGRDLFAGGGDAVLAGLVVVSTLLYATGAIAVAARIFGSEDVLYNEASTWAELFRRPRQARPVASLSNALACLCLIFSLSFFLQGSMRELIPGLAIDARPWVLAGVLIASSLILFVGLPLLSARARRIRLGSGFQLRLASPLAFLGALLLGLSLWPLVLELQVLFHLLDLRTISVENQERIVAEMRQFQQALPLWFFVLIYVLPAIAEELFFRGFLFAALKKVAKPATTILLSALLFALFHLAVTDRFGLERLLPSFLMGLILSWVCWRSGSVIPSVLLHACHNAALVLIGYWQSQQGGTGNLEVSHLPLLWLAAGAVGTLAGSALVYFGRGRPAPLREAEWAGGE